MSDLSAYGHGLLMGASLIIAIGAQNAFVLSQAIRRQHALTVALVCTAIDTALIAAGVCGIGAFVAEHATLKTGAAIGGAVFLIWFGLKSLMEARKSSALWIDADSREHVPLGPVLAATLAVSLLNPHVYLDTVIMLGAISGNFPGNGRYLFGLGAATASLIWFFGLSLAGTLLAPVFVRPTAWKVLHVTVCVMVWSVAAGLIYGLLTP